MLRSLLNNDTTVLMAGVYSAICLLAGTCIAAILANSNITPLRIKLCAPAYGSVFQGRFLGMDGRAKAKFTGYFVRCHFPIPHPLSQFAAYDRASFCADLNEEPCQILDFYQPEESGC